jgi:hypothetical protein
VGTRGLTNVVINGEKKVAQYGQWDHYPEGQGLTALRFLRGEGNVERLRENVVKLRDVTDADIKRVYAEAGVTDPDSDWITLDDAKKLEKVAPHLDRNMGAEILEYVADGKAEFVQRDLTFEDDALFCEGVFEVDFDRGVFEYREPGYGRASHAATFPLDALPTDDEFLKAARHPEDEDEDE